MLKVCLALPIFYPTFAGGPLRFLRYQPGLKKRDVYARVVAGTARLKDDFHPVLVDTSACSKDHDSKAPAIGEMLPVEHIDGLPVHRVRLPTKTGIRRTSAYFRSLIALCKYPETRPDVIQLHSFERVESIFWLWRLRRLRIPMVYAIQIARRNRQRNRMTQRLERALLRVFYNAFDGILTNSGEISDQLVKLRVKTPVSVIANGVDLGRYRPCHSPKERSKARRALGVTGSGPIILSIGAICPRKGTDLVIEAWRRIQDETPNAELVLVGPRHDLNNPNLASFRSQLEKQIAQSKAPGRVHLLGVRNDMNEVYAAADIVVHASAREGMPNVVLEAMACERPVILTPFLGQTSAMGRPGIEFEESPRTPSALGQAIAKLLNDSNRRLNLTRNARAWVESQLDIERSLDELASFYHHASHRRLRDYSPEPCQEKQRRPPSTTAASRSS